MQNGYIEGWYLRKLEMKDWGVYSVILERIIKESKSETSFMR